MAAGIRHGAGVRMARRRCAPSLGICCAGQLEGRCHRCLHTPSSGGVAHRRRLQTFIGALYPREDEIREMQNIGRERCGICTSVAHATPRGQSPLPPPHALPGSTACPPPRPPFAQGHRCWGSFVKVWSKWRCGPHQLGKLVKVGLHVRMWRIFFSGKDAVDSGVVRRSKVTAS